MLDGCYDGRLARRNRPQFYECRESLTTEPVNILGIRLFCDFTRRSLRRFVSFTVLDVYPVPLPKRTVRKRDDPNAR